MYERFLALHRSGAPLLLANAWDRGSTRVLGSLGYEALATTSSGYAGTLGLRDGQLTREQALTHAADLASATSLPVNADLEDGFGASPDAVAATVREAAERGLAGCSIEDFTRDRQAPIYETERAMERIAAAVEASSSRIVLTARCERHLYGQTELGPTIERLHLRKFGDSRWAMNAAVTLGQYSDFEASDADAFRVTGRRSPCTSTHPPRHGCLAWCISIEKTSR